MNYRCQILASISTIALLGCATAQENPNYQYSTQYKGASPYTTVTAQNTQVQTAPVRYQSGSYSAPLAPAVASHSSVQSASYTRVNHECLSRETNRQLIGGALGGSAGALAGKKIIGGTKGTVIGALAGGAAGYGIGDKTINCDPEPVFVASPQAQTYQSGQAQTLPAYQIPGGSTSARPATANVVNASVLSTTHHTSPTDVRYGETYGTPGYHATQTQAPVIINTAQNQYRPTTGSRDLQPIMPPSSLYAEDGSGPLAQAPSPSPTTGLRSAAGLHKVVEGNTVYSLARGLCSSVEEIKRLNSLDANFSIRLGENIKVPASQC